MSQEEGAVPEDGSESRVGKKFCTMGKHWVALEEFNKMARSKDGLQSYCRECGKAYQKGNYEKTKERRARYHKNRRRVARRKEVMQAWHEANPEANRIHRAGHRARQLGIEGTFSVAEWTKLQEYYDHHCLSCLQMKIGELEADHVVPLKEGGENTIGNIQPLCVSCNRKKGVRIHDFRPRWEALREGQALVEERGLGVIVVEMDYNRVVEDSYRWLSDELGVNLSLRVPTHMVEGDVPKVIRVTIEEVSEDEEPAVGTEAEVAEGADLQADPEG